MNCAFPVMCSQVLQVDAAALVGDAVAVVGEEAVGVRQEGVVVVVSVVAAAGAGASADVVRLLCLILAATSYLHYARELQKHGEA